MLVGQKEINNIDEALSLLTEDQRSHSRRVAKYCEIAFKTIASKDIYVSQPRAEKELNSQNTQLVYKSALYHDIGKLLPDAEDAPDHTKRGVELVAALYPDFSKLKYLEKKLITDGILDHHERLNGLGGPDGRKGDAVSYVGRIVAIADLLDNRALNLTSEDPIAEALDSLKEEVAAGFLDPEFFRAFSTNRAKLKKVFSEDLGDDLVIPVTDQWIKRKASRPMELVYKTACRCGMDTADVKNHIWFAEMRFKGTSKNDLKYEDVKKIVTANKLGTKLGEYFIYELADAYKRFTACGLNLGGAAMVLPGAYLNTKGIAKQIETILQDEELSKEEITLVIPEEASRKPSKQLIANVQECKEKGIRLLEEYEFLGFADVAEEIGFETEESIVTAQVRALQRKADTDGIVQ